MQDWNPFWTEEVTIENGGRHPLLLNRFHDHLEEYLIKGVVYATDRLRYISYCCWSIGDIENTINCKKYYEFEEAFRRREGALAIGTYLLKPDTVMGNYSIYGSNAMRGVIEKITSTYETSFEVLPSNKLGAYGQNYKGTMQKWGLTFISKDGIPHLTALGKELYEIMNNSYDRNDYYTNYKGENKVPGVVLYKWALINQYDNIVDENHKVERDFFKSVLFHLDIKEVHDGRRDSFTIYLECIAELEASSCNFNENYVRNILYYQRYFDINGKLHDYLVSPFLENTRFIWMIYEIQVYFSWWVSEYLRTFLRLLSGSPNGLSMTEVLGSIDKDMFNKIVSEYLEKSNYYFDMKFDNFINFVEESIDDTEWLFEDKLCYDSWENSFSGFSEVSAGLLIILALLNHKFCTIREDSRYIEIRMKLSEDFWFKDILEIMDDLRNKNVKDVIEVILNQFVIRQHNNAMYGKKDLRRCWFTMSGDKYQYQADSNSRWRPAKHENICNFLYDMGLIKIKDDTYVLSLEGRELYKKLKDDYYEE